MPNLFCNLSTFFHQQDMSKSYEFQLLSDQKYLHQLFTFSFFSLLFNSDGTFIYKAELFAHAFIKIRLFESIPFLDHSSLEALHSSR